MLVHLTVRDAALKRDPAKCDRTVFDSSLFCQSQLVSSNQTADGTIRRMYILAQTVFSQKRRRKCFEVFSLVKSRVPQIFVKTHCHDNRQGNLNMKSFVGKSFSRRKYNVWTTLAPKMERSSELVRLARPGGSSDNPCWIKRELSRHTGRVRGFWIYCSPTKLNFSKGSLSLQ